MHLCRFGSISQIFTLTLNTPLSQIEFCMLCIDARVAFYDDACVIRDGPYRAKTCMRL